MEKLPCLSHINDVHTTSLQFLSGKQNVTSFRPRTHRRLFALCLLTKTRLLRLLLLYTSYVILGRDHENVHKQTFVICAHAPEMAQSRSARGKRSASFVFPSLAAKEGKCLSAIFDPSPQKPRALAETSRARESMHACIVCRTHLLTLQRSHEFTESEDVAQKMIIEIAGFLISSRHEVFECGTFSNTFQLFQPRVYTHSQTRSALYVHYVADLACCVCPSMYEHIHIYGSIEILHAATLYA